jgi:Zn-dependent protease
MGPRRARDNARMNSAPGSFPDAALEQQFQAMREALATPAPASRMGLLLIVTLALFVFTQLGNSLGWMGVVVLVGVLLFHELGHLAGMKLFGYRDLKMFFIPFFGAAVSGKRVGVASWKEAVVLLLGPLPGIALGLVLAAMLSAGPSSPPSTQLTAWATALVIINAFNLLPVTPLDGGRLFHLLLFSRHRWLEIGFSAFAGLVLIAAFGVGLYLLPIIGVLILVGLPRQWRLRGAAERLRAGHEAWGTEPAQLPEAQLRAAFLAAKEVYQPAVLAQPRAAANVVEGLIDRAALRPPSVGASLLLLLPWLAGLIASFAALALIDAANPPQWQVSEVREGGFSIEMPRATPLAEVERHTPLGPRVMKSLDARVRAGTYTARWYDVAPGERPVDDVALARYLDGQRDKLVERAQGTLLDEVRLPGGTAGRQLRIREAGGSESLAQIRIDEERVFLLLAPAEPAADAARFFASFKRLVARAGS